MCVHVCVLTWACSCRGEMSMSDLFPIALYLNFLGGQGKVFHWKWKLTELAASNSAHRVLPSPPSLVLAFYIRAGDLNSVPHACGVMPSLAQPSFLLTFSEFMCQEWFCHASRKEVWCSALLEHLWTNCALLVLCWVLGKKGVLRTEILESSLSGGRTGNWYMSN